MKTRGGEGGKEQARAQPAATPLHAHLRGCACRCYQVQVLMALHQDREFFPELFRCAWLLSSRLLPPHRGWLAAAGGPAGQLHPCRAGRSVSGRGAGTPGALGCAPLTPPGRRLRLPTPAGD